jgi:hypothetical protein
MKRKLIPWDEGGRIGGYRRDLTGKYWDRAKIIVDGKEGRFYGTGSNCEEADAALRSFVNPQCTCFPVEPLECKIHPEAELYIDAFGLIALVCRFNGFDPNYERWPSLGEKSDGNIDYKVLDAWGFKP